MFDGTTDPTPNPTSREPVATKVQPASSFNREIQLDKDDRAMLDRKLTMSWLGRGLVYLVA